MATYIIIVFVILLIYSLWVKIDKKKSKDKCEDLATLILNNEWEGVCKIERRHLVFWSILLLCSIADLAYRLYNGLYPHTDIFFIVVFSVFFVRVLMSYRNARFNAGFDSQHKETEREKIRKFLDGCRITVIDSNTQDAMKVWQDAYTRDKGNGYYPVILEIDDYYCDFLDEDSEISDDSSFRKWRHNALCCQPPDGKQILSERLKEIKADYDEEEWKEEVVGDDAEYEAENELQIGSDKLWLVEVPVEHPWQVFAYIPMGGWDECPKPEEHMAIAKYWQEQYDAKVIHISGSLVEYELPHPVKGDNLKLAEEQYSYCSDFIEENYETLKTLENILSEATLWYFRWD